MNYGLNRFDPEQITLIITRNNKLRDRRTFNNQVCGNILQLVCKYPIFATSSVPQTQSEPHAHLFPKSLLHCRHTTCQGSSSYTNSNSGPFPSFGTQVFRWNYYVFLPARLNSNRMSFPTRNLRRSGGRHLFPTRGLPGRANWLRGRG